MRLNSSTILDEESLKHFEKLQEFLTQYRVINFLINPSLVRGLRLLH